MERINNGVIIAEGNKERKEGKRERREGNKEKDLLMCFNLLMCAKSKLSHICKTRLYFVLYHKKYEMWKNLSTEWKIKYHFIFNVYFLDLLNSIKKYN